MTLVILLSHRRSSFAAFISTGRGAPPFGRAYVLPPGKTGRAQQRWSAHLFATRDEVPGQSSAKTADRSGDKHCHDTLRLFCGVRFSRKPTSGPGAGQVRCQRRCTNAIIRKGAVEVDREGRVDDGSDPRDHLLDERERDNLAVPAACAYGARALSSRRMSR